MLPLNSVPESYVLTGEVREACTLVRKRQTLAENRTKYANKARGLLFDHGISKYVKSLTMMRRDSLQGLSIRRCSTRCLNYTST
jgi:hypothetical protein